jgi:S1-C subfamily serine protease
MPGDVSQIVYALARIEPTGLQLLGTGFAVAADKIATAYHVVGPEGRNLALIFPRISELSEYQDTTDQRVNAIPLTVQAVDPIHDLCVLQIAPGTSISFDYHLASTDMVPPGAQVFTYGFPHANYGRMVLTQQVAHVGARVLLETQGLKSKHIVLNTFAREGQSGGPVFDSTMRNIVAILLGNYRPPGGGTVIISGVDPATLHQTTHAISAEYLREML